MGREVGPDLVVSSLAGATLGSYMNMKTRRLPPLNLSALDEELREPGEFEDALFTDSAESDPPPLGDGEYGAYMAHDGERKAEELPGSLDAEMKAAVGSAAEPTFAGQADAVGATVNGTATPATGVPTAFQKRRSRRRRAAERASLGAVRYAYLVAVLAGLLWSGMFIAFVLGFQHHVAPLEYPPFQAVILAMLTVLPAAFMLLAAFAITQGARLASETRAARQLARDLVTPAVLAAHQTQGILETVRSEAGRAFLATRSAHNQLLSLRNDLTQETDRLTQAAGEAQRTARVVGETLGREREGIVELAATLQARSESIAGAVEQQTRLVADASDLARSQLREAEATLAARAADLATSSTNAAVTTRDAGDYLAQHTSRLDATAAALAERLRHLDGRLAEQRIGLETLVDGCNLDQEDIAARLESRRAQLIEVVAQARIAAAELGDASGQSAQTLSELVSTAAQRARDLVQTTAAEHQSLAQLAGEARAQAEADLQRAISALGAASDEAHRSATSQAEQGRLLATAHVEAARSQVEQLGELAFDAGQRANQAFDMRINEARKLIEQSAAMVEEAGIRSAGRIESGLDATRAAIGELAGALADIDVRMAKLPDEARAQAEAVRAAVERGVADLTTSARRLAEETQAIDAGFQERVRRNYETLSEASRLMGRVVNSPENFVASASGPAGSSMASGSPGSAQTSTIPAAVSPAQVPGDAAAPPAASVAAVASSAVGAAAGGTPAAPAPQALSIAASSALQARASGSTALEDSFIPPETVFRRETPPGTSGIRLDFGFPERKPVFAGGRPAALGNVAPVFGRAQARTGQDEAPSYLNPASNGQGSTHSPAPPGSAPPGSAPAGPDPPSEDSEREDMESLLVAPVAAGPSLRPRLKLTPTEADEALRTVFDPLQSKGRDPETTRLGAETSSGRAGEHELDEWTWKDLLSSIDEAPVDDDSLAEQMIGEIAALGVDAGALLPSARLDEINLIVLAGDPTGVRDAVRRLAPAAVRRLSRRVLTDNSVREKADRYVRRYDGLLRESVERDPTVTSTLLSSDPGRAFLLLDAAIGDLR